MDEQQKENTMENVQSDGKVTSRENLGRCEYSGCKEDAYYTIDFGCDDMTAIVCNYHHNAVLALFGLPDCEGE